MSKLPPNASVENLKKQAKQLFKNYQDGDPDACARIESQAPPSQAVPDDAPTLQTAQLALAREYGYPNWQRLTEAVADQNSIPDQLCWTDPKGHPLDQVFPALDSFLKPGLNVIHVSCSWGSITRDVARRVSPGTVLGLSADSDRIEYARQAAAETDLPNLSFEVGDDESLPVDDSVFDLAYCLGLEVSPAPAAVLAEMKRVVKDEGWVVSGMQDYGAATFYPACPAAERIYKAWSRLQESEASGSTKIRPGREIASLFRQAGFASPEVSTYGIPHSTALASDPERLEGRYVQMRHHLRPEHPRFQALEQIGLVDRALSDEAQRELNQWRKHPDAFQTWCMGVLGAGRV